MHPDSFAVRVDDVAPSGRVVCIEICANAFYGKAWSTVSHGAFDGLVTGLEVLSIGSSQALAATFSPSATSPGTTRVTARALPPADSIGIGISIDFPEGAVRTHIPVSRSSLGEFASQLRAAWRSPASSTVEIRRA